MSGISTMRTMLRTRRLCAPLRCAVLMVLLAAPASAWMVMTKNSQIVSLINSPRWSTQYAFNHKSAKITMAQVSEKEAKAGIDKVVSALRKDTVAKSELGNLVKVNNVLGFGSPNAGTLAVRFNASFKKGGMGRSSIPLPFGLGQSNESEGRGTMVGQVKASIDISTGKVTSCSVFRDLGYGRAFNLKV